MRRWGWIGAFTFGLLHGSGSHEPMAAKLITVRPDLDASMIESGTITGGRSPKKDLIRTRARSSLPPINTYIIRQLCPARVSW